MGLWAVGNHAVSQPPYWVVVSLGVLAMNGATWTDVACVSANVRSFPMDRGTAIGEYPDSTTEHPKLQTLADEQKILIPQM